MKQINGVDISQNFIFKRKSGRYHGSSPMSGNTQVAFTANTLYAVPFFIADVTTATSIGVHVTTAAAAKNIRLGIYKDNDSIYPGTLLLDAGTVATDATGVQEIVINQALGENTLYWLAAISNGTPTISSQISQSFWDLIGLTNAAFNVNIPGMYSYALAYGALPDPYAAGASTVTNQFKIMLKL